MQGTGWRLLCLILSPVVLLLSFRVWHLLGICLIITAGHSLGGALATLAAYDIAKALESPQMCTAQHEVICYTFGSPRTGQLPVSNHVSLPHSWMLSLGECWGLMHCQMRLAPHVLAACRQLCLRQGL